jgi:hypothetical protein
MSLLTSPLHREPLESPQMCGIRRMGQGATEADGMWRSRPRGCSCSAQERDHNRAALCKVGKGAAVVARLAC